MPQIKLLDQLTPDIADKTNKDLVEHERLNGVDVNYKRFSLVINDNNEIVGVLNTYTNSHL